VIGGELENAVAEPDVPGALAGGGEKGFRRWRMRIFFEKMMFHHPGIVVAKPVGGLELRQRVLVKLQLIAGSPRARQLQLIKDAELHVVSLPPTACCFSSVVAGEDESSLGPIPPDGRSLALTARMVRFAGRLSRRSMHDLLIEISCPRLRRTRIPR
jgi:hypothetical protein